MGIKKHLCMYLLYEYKPAIVCKGLYAKKQSSKPTSHQPSRITSHGAFRWRVATIHWTNNTVIEYPPFIVASREGGNEPSTLGTQSELIPFIPYPETVGFMIYTHTSVTIEHYLNGTHESFDRLRGCQHHISRKIKQTHIFKVIIANGSMVFCRRIII